MPAPRIDKATLERMLLAYMQNPNPTHVARSAGVSWAAAKKYIVEGAPALGIGAFAVEARQILRAGDKIVRLTEVTKEIRVQVEAKDLGAYQDLLFAFEAIIHDAMGLVRGRIAREKDYFAKVAELTAKGAAEAVVGKIKRPQPVNLNDLKGLGVALHELRDQKREFWDRMEIVTRTEVEIGGGAEGLADAEAAEAPDFATWEPHEIAAYVDSINAGRDPVFPSWLHETCSEKDSLHKKRSDDTLMISTDYTKSVDESANANSDKKGPEESGQSSSILFPPGGVQEDD